MDSEEFGVEDRQYLAELERHLAELVARLEAIQKNQRAEGDTDD